MRSAGGGELKAGNTRFLGAPSGSLPYPGETPGALSLVLEPARTSPCSSCGGQLRAPSTAADSLGPFQNTF